FTTTNTIVANLGSGSDTLVLTLQQFAFNVTVQPDPANGQQTNIFLDDTVSGKAVVAKATGAEVVSVNGVDGNDNLSVNSSGDSTTRVQSGAAPFTDQVTASDLATRVEFTNINAFSYEDVFTGTNAVTFVTQNLKGGANTFQALLNFGDDTFIIEGADG